MSVRFITPQILHVDMGTMYELGSLFIRMQEFYECPNDKFRGKYFTMDQYMDWYASNNEDGQFTYFEDWAGFNIPGDVLIKFHRTFHDLRPKEMDLFDHLKDFVLNNDKNFYVIGSYAAKQSTVAHELRHAFYYLNDSYRRQCEDIFKTIPESVMESVTEHLLDIGYSDIVVPDETQAYFGSEDVESLSERFNLTEDEVRPWAEAYRKVRP